MRLFKKLIVIVAISAFALIAGSVSYEHTCDNGISFPFSFLVKTIASNNSGSGETRLITDRSMFSSAAFADGKKSNIKVTFIELGSVNCIPCKMMQPVMKQVEEKYADQVKVVFYDVWTEKGQPYAKIYGINAIPTQVFLNKEGKEYSRHLGFYPFEEVEKVLKKGGVN
jgi:thioredoxin 1